MAGAYCAPGSLTAVPRLLASRAMQSMNPNGRATLALILATACLTAIGCGDDDVATADAGGVPDSGRMDVDAGPPDAGAMGVDAGVSADAGTGTDAGAVADAGPAADAGSPLTILPPTPMATGCSVDTVTFTVSGGTPPYTWTTSEGGTTNLTIVDATTARWHDGSDNFCGTGGTVIITVTDSTGAMATATMTVLPG